MFDGLWAKTKNKRQAREQPSASARSKRSTWRSATAIRHEAGPKSPLVVDPIKVTETCFPPKRQRGWKHQHGVCFLMCFFMVQLWGSPDGFNPGPQRRLRALCNRGRQARAFPVLASHRTSAPERPTKMESNPNPNLSPKHKSAVKFVSHRASA